METFRKVILGIILLASPSIVFAGTGDIKKGHEILIKENAIINQVSDNKLNKNALNIYQDKLNNNKILTNYASRLKFRTFCAVPSKASLSRNHS